MAKLFGQFLELRCRSVPPTSRLRCLLHQWLSASKNDADLPLELRDLLRILAVIQAVHGCVQDLIPVSDYFDVVASGVVVGMIETSASTILQLYFYLSSFVLHEKFGRHY